MTEIVFEVYPDELDGGFTAAALGHDIFTEAETMSELYKMVVEAVRCHFFDFSKEKIPNIIHLCS